MSERLCQSEAMREADTEQRRGERKTRGSGQETRKARGEIVPGRHF